jgi:hypothetical protein
VDEAPGSSTNATTVTSGHAYRRVDVPAVLDDATVA